MATLYPMPFIHVTENKLKGLMVLWFHSLCIDTVSTMQLHNIELWVLRSP